MIVTLVRHAVLLRPVLAADLALHHQAQILATMTLAISRLSLALSPAVAHALLQTSDAVLLIPATTTLEMICTPRVKSLWVHQALTTDARAVAVGARAEAGETILTM